MNPLLSFHSAVSRRGKYADFVVLDRDIMTVAERDIVATRVVATYIGGRAVYEAPGGAPRATAGR